MPALAAALVNEFLECKLPGTIYWDEDIKRSEAGFGCVILKHFDGHVHLSSRISYYRRTNDMSVDIVVHQSLIYFFDGPFLTRFVKSLLAIVLNLVSFSLIPIIRGSTQEVAQVHQPEIAKTQRDIMRLVSGF